MGHWGQIPSCPHQRTSKSALPGSFISRGWGASEQALASPGGETSRARQVPQRCGRFGDPCPGFISIYICFVDKLLCLRGFSLLQECSPDSKERRVLGRHQGLMGNLKVSWHRGPGGAGLLLPQLTEPWDVVMGSHHASRSWAKPLMS